jgi:membrane protein
LIACYFLVNFEARKNIRMIKKLIDFIKNDLWKVETDGLPKSKLFWIQQLRIFVLAGRGFNEDNILLRASGLTFYTLISIVPVIAMAFGIAKGFGFEAMLNEQIKSYFDAQPQVSEMLIKFSSSFLSNTKGGLIAGAGILVLIWTVMKVLTNIELSFNAIWGIKKERTLIRKFTEYISIMIVAPIFIILSGGLTAFISSTSTTIEGSYLHQLGIFFTLLLEIIPFIIISLLFTFIYIALPNTKVQFKSALIAGVIAGTSFQTLEWVYFSFQIFAVKYNAIYGSFAAFPLFLVWLQSSWLIVLFGCELAFANQNVQQYIYENEVNTISIKHNKKITLLILVLINLKFTNGEKALTANEIANNLKLPIRLVQKIIMNLIDLNLIIETHTNEHKTVGFCPAKDLSNLQTSDLIVMLEESGSEDVPVKDCSEWEWASKTVEDFLENNHSSNKNLTFKEILTQIHPS